MENLTEESLRLLIDDVKRWSKENQWSSRVIIGVARRTYGVELTKSKIDKILKENKN